MMIISPFCVELKKIDSWKDPNEKSSCEHWENLIVFAKNICAMRTKVNAVNVSFKKIIEIFCWYPE